MFGKSGNSTSITEATISYEETKDLMLTFVLDSSIGVVTKG